MTPFTYYKFTNRKYEVAPLLAPNVSIKLNVMFVINTFSKIVSLNLQRIVT